MPKPDKLDSKTFLRVIVVLARTHPGESPSSFVIQGLVEFLLGSHPIANILRENFIFKIVPMVNPDGVFLGNNRCNLIGQDLNRAWHLATEFSHPTLVAIKNLMMEIDNSDVSFLLRFCLNEKKAIKLFLFSTIRLILCSISTHIPAFLDHLSTGTPMMMYIATNDIWSFQGSLQ